MFLPIFLLSLKEIRLGDFELLDFLEFDVWTGFLLRKSNIQEFLYVCIFVGIFIVFDILYNFDLQSRTSYILIATTFM